MLITKEYKKLNEQLHHDRIGYGTSSGKWATTIVKMTNRYRTKDVLDYGCGKSRLQKNLKFTITQYDPAVPEFTEHPAPHDIVVCTDVLEHIEPECLDEVLDDLKTLTKKAVFLTIATRKACKTLADGRNAHLIVEPSEWWIPKLKSRFKTIQIRNSGTREFTFHGEPL